MNDTGGVCFGKRVGNLHRVLQRLFQAQGTALEKRSQRGAANVLHGDEVGIAVGADLINRDDVGMAEGRRSHGLAAEAAPGILGARTVSGQHFDGHVTIERDIVGAIHHPHAARSKGFEYFVMRDPSADHRLLLSRMTQREFYTVCEGLGVDSRVNPTVNRLK